MVRTADLQSNSIPESEESPDLPNVGVIGAYRNRHRQGTGMPRIKKSRGASKPSTLTLVRGPRSIIQAFNPIYLKEPVESTALGRKRDTHVRGAKSNGLLTGWKPKMSNILSEDDDLDASDSERISECTPATISEEFIASRSLSIDNIRWDAGDKGKDKMSKEKGMAPEELRPRTLSKAPESSARLCNPKKDYEVLYKELCELVSDSQKVKIPCKQKPRVPAAASRPVEEPKEAQEIISLSEWIVRGVEDRGICVEGKRLGVNLHYWHSNIIVHRIQSDKLKTMTGRVYQLTGDLDRATMSDVGYPPWLIAKFLNGFPEDWKSCVRYFCEVANRNQLQKMEANPAGKSTKPQSRKPAATSSDSDPDVGALKRKVGIGRPKKALAKEPRSSCNQEAQTSTAEPWSNPTDNTRLSEASCVSTTSRSGRHIKPVLKFWCGERLSVNCLLDTSIVREGEDMLTYSLEKVRNRVLNRRSNAATKKMLPKKTSSGGDQPQLDLAIPKFKASDKIGVKTPVLNKAKQRKNKALKSPRLILTPMRTKQDVRSKCLQNKVRYNSPNETSGDNRVFGSDLNVEKGGHRGPKRKDPSTVRNLTFELDNGEDGGVVIENVAEKVNRKPQTSPKRKASKTQAASSSESQKNTEPKSRKRSHSAHRQKAPNSLSNENDEESQKSSEKRARNQKTSNCPSRPPSDSGDHQGRNTKELEGNPRKPPPLEILSNILKKPTPPEPIEQIGSKVVLEKDSRTWTKVQEKERRSEPRKQSDVEVAHDSEDKPVLKRLVSTKTGKAAPQRRTLPFRGSKPVGFFLAYEDTDESPTPIRKVKKPESGKTHLAQGIVRRTQPPRLKRPQSYLESSSSDWEEKPRKDSRNPKMSNVIESEDSEEEPITGKESGTATNAEEKQKQVGFLETDSEDELTLRRASRQVANDQKKKKVGLFKSQDFEKELKSGKESTTTTNDLKKQPKKIMEESKDLEEEPILKKAPRLRASAQKKKKQVGLLESPDSGDEQIKGKESRTSPNATKKQKQIGLVGSSDLVEEPISRKASRQAANAQKEQKPGFVQYKDSGEKSISGTESRTDPNAQKLQSFPAQKQNRVVESEASEEQISRKMPRSAANTPKMQKDIGSLVSQDSEQERTSRNESRKTAINQKMPKTAEEQIGLEDKKISRKVSSQRTSAQKKQATTEPALERRQSARSSRLKIAPAEFNLELEVSPGRDSRRYGNSKGQPPSDIASSRRPGLSPPCQEPQGKSNEEGSLPVSASPQKKSSDSSLSKGRLSFVVEPMSNSSSEDEQNNSWEELILPRYNSRAKVSAPAPTRRQCHPGTSEEPECDFEKLQGKLRIPQNSKMPKPNLRGVSGTDSRGKEVNEDHKAAAGQKKPKATKNVRKNVNSRGDEPTQPQKNDLAQKSSGKWEPLNPYAEILREKEWTEEEIQRLDKAVSSIPMNKRGFWQDVATAVGGRSADECGEKFFEKQVKLSTPPKKKAASSKKQQEVNEEKKEAVKIAAKVGTLKRRRQMREFLNQMPQDDNYDDMFSDELYRDLIVKLPPLPPKSDDDDFVLENLEPVTPSSPKFPFVATPQCEFLTPGMLGTYDSDQNDQDVCWLQKELKCDMLPLKRPFRQKSGPLFNATPTSRPTPFIKKGSDTSVIGKLFAAKDTATSDEEEESDYYFSDSEEQ